MGFFQKIAEGIKKTKDNFQKKLYFAFSARALDDEFYENLEEALLAAEQASQRKVFGDTFFYTSLYGIYLSSCAW